MRYFKEIPKIRKIIVNDLDPAAVESIKKNIEFNKLPTDKVIANLADARYSSSLTLTLINVLLVNLCSGTENTGLSSMLSIWILTVAPFPF